MTTLSQLIEHLYPNAPKDPMGMPTAYQIVDEGKGPYIYRWDETILGPKPDDAKIASATLAVLRKNKTVEMRLAAFREMDTHLIPDYEGRDLIFIILDKTQGINDPRLPALADIRKRLASKLAYIGDPARTVAELEAVAWA